MISKTKKNLWAIFFLFIGLSCVTATPKEINLKTGFNTIITIHYKKESDKNFFKFQQYDPFFLESYAIISPPPHETENEKLKTTIKLNLDKPLLVLFGFTEFYIEPKDNLDMDFTVLKTTKTEYKDSIKINRGIGIITLHRKRLFLNSAFANQLKESPEKGILERLISEKTLNAQTESSMNQLFSAYPTLKDSIRIRDYFQGYFTQYYFSTLTYNLSIGLKNMNDDLKSFATFRIKNLSVSLSHDLKIKLRNYWYGMAKVFEQAIDPEFKKSLYAYHLIEPVINDYDSITRQFFLLLALKNNVISVEDRKSSDIEQNNLQHLVKYISYPKFKPYVEKFRSGNSKGEYINSDVQNSVLFDYNMKQIRFNDIFNKSSQKYILFDFCGSWCAPCIEEMKKYATSRKLDTSIIVKPVWIFFENNKTDWLSVIEKYNLKKDNCFLVEGQNTITKDFGELFSWRGEFPHHFLFNNRGKIIDNDVQSFSSFDPQSLINDKINLNPAPPPPPKK